MKKVIFAFLLSILILPCSSFAASLSGTVFHDYNGNGLLDPGEPGIAGAEVSEGSQSFISDENGSYWIGGLSNGAHSVSIQSPMMEGRLDFRTNPNGDPIPEYRYISVFKGWVDIPTYEMNGVQVPDQHLADTEILTNKDLITVLVAGDTKYDIGLMNGFLTLPYRAEDAKSESNPEGFWRSNYVDLDVKGDTVRNFEGNNQMIIGCPCDYPEGYGTEDQHPGIDLEGPFNTFVLSPAPGKVSYVGQNVGVRHIISSEVSKYQTNLGHIDQPLVQFGEGVYRGQIIATNGSTNTSHPHIHFALYDQTVAIDDKPAVIDPFKDLLDSTLRFEEYEVTPYGHRQLVSIGSPGYWTKTNDPQYAFTGTP